MRPIKFRAWHFKLNRMFSAEEMTHDQMALLPDGHFANIHGGDTSKSTIYPHTSMMPLQFTGLHDKNGKEIYEGDILRSTAWGTTVAIKWSEQTAGWKLYNQDGQDAPAYPEWLTTMYEVIGNIYEDEELLSNP